MTKKAPDIYLNMPDLRHVFAGFALGIYTCFPEKRDEFADIMRTWADTPSRTEAARLALHCLADDVDGTLRPPTIEPPKPSLRVVEGGAA